MSEVKLCRICVRKDVKMYEHDRYKLMFYYKEITGSKISSRDCLPKWFCFECAALLHKYHAFKKKCHNGQKVFKNLLETEHVSLQDIKTRKKITSSEPYLQILSVSQNVKTFSIKHSKIKTSTKNNYNTFTEVFLHDVKSVETQSFKVTNKELSKTTIENNGEAIEQPNDDDFQNDFDDSNDSAPLVITEDYVKDKTSNGETVLNNDTSTKTDFIETKYDTQNTSHDTQNPSHDTQNPSHNTLTSYDTRSAVIKPTHQKESEMNVNLDNKFQRSVKKKFLDENHWTKITLTDEEATRRFQAKALEHKYLTADYKCLDCYRTFSQEDMMKRHVKLRHCESLGPNECRHCRMRFKWKSRLQKHLKEHYTIYKCLRCELSFPVEISAFQHDYSHNGVTWTCAHCGQGFRHSSTYYTHLRKHKSKYVCTLCGVSFVSEFGLFMHKRVKHVINEDLKELVSNTYCKVCDITFDTLKGYEDHFAESALHATSSEVTEGLPLKTRCSKKRVPRISTNCTSCGKTFSTYAAFSKHHLSAHPSLALPRPRPDRPDGQRQVCEVCGLTLASAWSLANHLNTHSRDKRYTCKTCGMQLSSRSVLQRHQLTHSHERNFVCDRCDKRFTQRSGLKLHLKTHEKEPCPTRSRKKRGESQHVMEYFKSYSNLANTYR